MADQHPNVSPDLFFSAVEGFQRTGVIKAAVELEVFTSLGKDRLTAAELAARCKTSPRGMRSLCDYLTVLGFLTKQDQRYALTPDSAAFLDKKSPAYLGGIIGFMLSDHIRGAWDDVVGAVRRGGPSPTMQTMAPEHPVWVHFARSMAPMMRGPANAMGGILTQGHHGPMKVLDLAAGHGLFGITIAQQIPGAQIVGQDWPNVLQVATENARAAGVEKRYTTLPGSAFDVDFGQGFDLVLLTNFLHHFDIPTCEGLLRKIHAALKPDGRVAILEFVPNEDRVSPPQPAKFSMSMLTGTPSGDAYTYAELDAMCRSGGFARTTLHPLPPAPGSLIVGQK